MPNRRRRNRTPAVAQQIPKPQQNHQAHLPQVEENPVNPLYTREEIAYVFSESRRIRHVMLREVLSVIIALLLSRGGARDLTEGESLFRFYLSVFAIIFLNEAIRCFSSCNEDIKNMAIIQEDEDLSASTNELISSAAEKNVSAYSLETTFRIIKPLVFNYSVPRMAEVFSPEVAAIYAAGFLVSEVVAPESTQVPDDLYEIWGRFPRNS